MKYIKYIIAVVVVLIVGIVIGAKVFSTHTVRTLAGASVAGSTNSTQRLASITWSLATPSSTTTSILNSDSQDRVIETAKWECTGVGTSFTAYTGAGLTSTGVQITAATTSGLITEKIPTTNLIFDSNDTLATTTGFAYQSSSTPGTTSPTPANRIWASGSYLTFQTNATNTAACTIGVNYIPE